MSRPPQDLSVSRDADGVEACCFELLSSLLHLDREIACGEAATNRFDRAFALLAALPLTSSDFSVSARRLGNVRHYNASGEAGAATYELRLLIRSIERIAKVIFRVTNNTPIADEDRLSHGS